MCGTLKVNKVIHFNFIGYTLKVVKYYDFLSRMRAIAVVSICIWKCGCIRECSSTLQKQMGNSNPFFWVKILATQITHSLSWNDSGIAVVEIPSTFYG